MGAPLALMNRARLPLQQLENEREAQQPSRILAAPSRHEAGAAHLVGFEGFLANSVENLECRFFKTQNHRHRITEIIAIPIELAQLGERRVQSLDPVFCARAIGTLRWDRRRPHIDKSRCKAVVDTFKHFSEMVGLQATYDRKGRIRNS